MRNTGRRHDPADVFLSILGEAARRAGGDAPLRLAQEIDLIGPSRVTRRARREPIVAQLPGCLIRGPATTAQLRGAISEFAPKLTWNRAPSLSGMGDFPRRHAYCEIVGPDAHIASDRLKAGLFLIAPKTHYPPHEHAAEEIYLPLSGPVQFGLDGRPARTRAPGRFLDIPPWTPHEILSLEHTVLLAWAWLGDINGPYRMTAASD